MDFVHVMSLALAQAPGPPPPPRLAGSCRVWQRLGPVHLARRLARRGAALAPPPPPSSRTIRTRRVPHPVLIGHAARRARRRAAALMSVGLPRGGGWSRQSSAAYLVWLEDDAVLLPRWPAALAAAVLPAPSRAHAAAASAPPSEPFMSRRRPPRSRASAAAPAPATLHAWTSFTKLRKIVPWARRYRHGEDGAVGALDCRTGSHVSAPGTRKPGRRGDSHVVDREG